MFVPFTPTQRMDSQKTDMRLEGKNVVECLKSDVDTCISTIGYCKAQVASS
jgi:hypothetical protein